MKKPLKTQLDIPQPHQIHYFYRYLNQPMKNLLPILVLYLAPFFTHAQNMVPNGDFEYYTTCPIIESRISNCLGWRSYHQGTSDYFNACNSSGTIWGGVPKIN